MFKRRKKGYRYNMLEMKDIRNISPKLETFKKKKKLGIF